MQRILDPTLLSAVARHQENATKPRNPDARSFFISNHAL